MILIDMKMPRSCQDCPAFGTKACDKWDKHKTFSDQRTKRHNDCPLKSIDGLIEKIEQDDEIFMYNKSKYTAETVIPLWRLRQIIKEYCGGELE